MIPPVLRGGGGGGRTEDRDRRLWERDWEWGSFCFVCERVCNLGVVC